MLGREWVVERACGEIVGGTITDERAHSRHNYTWRGAHNGRDLWVERKGATPAFPGQPRLPSAARWAMTP